MSIFRSFQSTVNRFVPRQLPPTLRLLVDSQTGSPVGIESPNASGPDGIWTPVDLTAAQIASPTAEMIADLNATYRLNVAPYTRYQSNGSALVAGTVSGSGAFTTLSVTGGATTLDSSTAPVVISGNTSQPAVTAGTGLQVAGSNSAAARVVIDSFGFTSQLVGRRSQGTAQAPTAVASGNNLFSISAFGYGATAYSGGRASLNLTAAEAWTDTAQGTYVDIQTTPIGTATAATVLRVQNNGIVSVGTTAISGASKLQVTGGISADAVMAASVRTLSAAGPTWTGGTGVPATTEPKGSLFSRTDGAAGSTLYVTQGGGVWAAVAAV